METSQATSPTTTLVPPALPKFGDLLRQAFHVWKMHWRKIAVLGLAPAIISFLLGYVFSNGRSAEVKPEGVALALLLVAAACIFVGMIWLNARITVAQIRLALDTDDSTSAGAAWRAAKGMAWPFFWIGALSSLVVFGGYLALFVPGVIWSLSFIFAPFLLVKEGLRGRDALVRSRQLVQGNWWWIWLQTLVFGIFMLLIYSPFMILSSVFEGNEIAKVVLNFVTTLFGLAVVTPVSLGFFLGIMDSLVLRKGSALVPMPHAKTVYTVAAVFGVLLPVLLAIFLFSAFKYLS
jgi:hypothetical protein